MGRRRGPAAPAPAPVPTLGHWGRGPNIGQRLAEVEKRLESLDNAIREVHPNYAEPIVQRCEHLAEVARANANRIFGLLQMHMGEVEAKASRVKEEADEACARLKEAANRHQSEGAVLRRELGGVKELIDERSLQIERDGARQQKILDLAIEQADRGNELREACDMQLARLAKLESLAAEVRADLREKKISRQNKQNS